jgi:hypothetical protein
VSSTWQLSSISSTTLLEKGGLGILGYSDSDMGGDVDDSKSTLGMIFFLSNNPATWNLQKQ